MASLPWPRPLTVPARTTLPSSLRPLRRSEPPPRAEGPSARLLAEAVAGLGRTPKSLPSRALFDAAGARLFAELVATDENGIGRRELSLLRGYGDVLGSAIGEDVQLVDLACGDGARTSLLLEHLRAPARVALVDRVPGAAARAAGQLAAAQPDLPVLAVDAADPWAVRVPTFARAARTVAHLPSSLIGELEPREAKAVLQRLASECGPHGGLLLGVDLKRDARALEAAYADRSGVAAALSSNVLTRLVREHGASFDPSGFEHRAVYDAAKGRVELQLVSKRWQWAALHGHWFNFGAGETITTLVAYKYTVQWLSSLAASAGWKVEQVILGEDRSYALVLLGI